MRYCVQTFHCDFSLALIPSPSLSPHTRCRRHRGNNDPWAQREGDSQPAGEKHHRDHVHHHRHPELAEIREPHFGRVRLHLLHRPDDHFPRVAGLLLYPEVSICKRQGQEPGELQKVKENYINYCKLKTYDAVNFGNLRRYQDKNQITDDAPTQDKHW